MAEREAKWEAFMTDPEWSRIRVESQLDGPINDRVSNYFLQPTAYSAVR